MSLRLFDTAARELRDFTPLEPGRVGIYICGLTTQAEPHIGHVRFAVAFDVLRRWLAGRYGYDVTLVRNVTDIDDKILAKSAAAGEAWFALSYRNELATSAALDALGHDPGFAAEPTEPTPSIVIDVLDDGPGVPAELSDRIFNPFFTTKTTGSGLGLPIVRKIVDAHDGRIDLSSEPGRGTRFRVTLPVSSKSSWFK